MTVEELADILRLQPETVRQMARDGRLPARKIGRVWRFSSLDVEKWLSVNYPENIPGGMEARVDDRIAEQQVLYREPSEASDNGNGFKDPAFTENRNQAIHRWVPWVAGFSSQFVRDCFDRYISSDVSAGTPTVLDPFAGVGTTLVEAMRRGYRAVGFEINPYAAMVARAKVKCWQIPVPELELESRRFAHHMHVTDYEGAPLPLHVRPDGFRSRIPFYSESIERQVLHALDFIRRIENRAMRDLFSVAFGSVMVRFSNYSYEPSLGSRPGSGKPLIEHADVASAVTQKLRDMSLDIRSFQSEIAGYEYALQGQVFSDSIFRWEMYLNKGCVDLVVTSPPYLNNYHYVRNTRPHLFWLDLIQESRQLKYVEMESFGKYWQTVRDQPAIELTFELPELQSILDRLRTLNVGKGPYGGPGWANYASTYFNDTYRFCETLTRLLKPGALAVIVIGNSILQGVEVKTDRFFADIGTLCGLRCEGIHQLRTKRVGNSIVGSGVRNALKNEARAQLYEVAVLLRLPA